MGHQGEGLSWGLGRLGRGGGKGSSLVVEDEAGSRVKARVEYGSMVRGEDGGGGFIRTKKNRNHVQHHTHNQHYLHPVPRPLHARGLVRLIILLTSSSQGRISGTSNTSPSSPRSRSSSSSSSSFSLASINRSLSSCAELSFLLLRSLCRASSSSSSPSCSFAFSFGGEDEEEEDEGESREVGGRPDRGLFVVVIAVASSDVPFSSTSGGGGGGKKSSESSTMFNLKDCSGLFSSGGLTKTQTRLDFSS